MQCKSMPEYTRVCQSMPEYARVCQSMPEYARVFKSTPEYARVCQSMPEYARVCQSMPGYARVCQSTEGGYGEMITVLHRGGMCPNDYKVVKSWQKLSLFLGILYCGRIERFLGEEGN